MIGRLLTCCALLTMTPLAQSAEIGSPFEKFVATDWEIITPWQWSRKITVYESVAIVTVGIMLDGDILFQVFRPCKAPTEARLLMWHAGSPTGYSLDCKMNPDKYESVAPPMWEEAAGDLPKEVEYMLKWFKSHPGQSRSRMI